jgi:hypothetical protein
MLMTRSRLSMQSALEKPSSSLTASLHSEPDDPSDVARITSVRRGKAGRLIYNGYPTGVAVSGAQPAAVLPEELREPGPDIPRRVDGALGAPAANGGTR